MFFFLVSICVCGYNLLLPGAGASLVLRHLEEPDCAAPLSVCALVEGGKTLPQAVAEPPAWAAACKPPQGGVTSVSQEPSAGSGAVTATSSAAPRPAPGYRRCRWCGCCLGRWQQALVHELLVLVSKTGFYLLLRLHEGQDFEPEIFRLLNWLEIVPMTGAIPA